MAGELIPSGKSSTADAFTMMAPAAHRVMYRLGAEKMLVVSHHCSRITQDVDCARAISLALGAARAAD